MPTKSFIQKENETPIQTFQQAGNDEKAAKTDIERSGQSKDEVEEGPKGANSNQVHHINSRPNIAFVRPSSRALANGDLATRGSCQIMSNF